MIQQNASTSSQEASQSPAHTSLSEDRRAYPSGKRDETGNAVSYFTVTRSVAFKPMMTPERRAGYQQPSMVRLVSAISLSTTPTRTATEIPVPSAIRTLTINHKTKSGRYYVWNQSHGGWVESGDGISPRLGAPVLDEELSGTSHGGSEGGY